MVENEDENLMVTGLENSIEFTRVWASHPDIPSFLSGHEYIPLRNTNVSSEEAHMGLNIYTDVDGVTIEWKNLAATTHVFHHLFFIPRGQSSLTNVYHLLKKREDLTKYTSESRQVIRDCVGAKIFTDCGWEYVVALLPKFDNKIRYDKTAIRQLTLTWIIELKAKLRQRFIDAVPGGHLRQTIDKNNLNDLSQIFILPGDSVTVLRLFQECLDSLVTPQGFRKILFSYRFGEKNRESVNIPIREPVGISKVCVHVGVSIEPSLDDESLIWSRTGLEKVIGNRGSLTTVCSLYECANFQSNLDGLALHVSGELRRVCLLPERIQFVQLYADLPHSYPKTRYHPVSAAAIIAAGLRNATDALVKDAREYISQIRSNFMKVTHSVCRMEFVVSLPVITGHVSGDELISRERLTQLLRDHALVVPFGDGDFMDCLRQIGFHLCDTLEMLLDEFKGTCSSASVWQAYQYELAVEKLLWGHPLTYMSNQCAVNLGPGLDIPTRCATDQFVFLILENKFACCFDERSTPPLTIYSGSQCVQKQLAKLFGFSDHLDASYLVLGRRLVELILNDMYDVGSAFVHLGTFISWLKQGDHSLRVVSVVSRSSLANQLNSVQKCKFPMVYMCLLKMLREKGKDVELTIRKGLDELKLCHFPAFRYRDHHGNKCLNWHYSYGVWAIRDLCDNDGGTVESRGTLLCALVLNELERRKLCYTRSLNGTNKHFPWVTASLRKLDELKLEDESLVRIMTFVTCVAFLEGGRFVDYNELRDLLQQLPFSQLRLRELEIQSKFLVNNMNKFMIWRLHASIPRQPLKNATEDRAQPIIQRHRIDETEERVTELDTALRVDENDHEIQTMGRNIVASGRPRHLPTNQKGRWSMEEMEILHNLHETVAEGTPVMAIYNQYQTECRSLNIPDRSFAAFRAKFKRL